MINNEKKICIVGTGGFGREALCCLIDRTATTEIKVEEIACFMVSDEHLKESKIMGIDVISLSNFDPTLYNVVVAIGDPSSRKKMVNNLPSATTYTTIIHPNAVISKWVEIGEGSIITAGTILTCNIKIGKHSHLTIARKLLPWQYEKSWLEYSHKHFTGRFIADGMLLLKRLAGEMKYEIVQRFEFQNLPVTVKQGDLFS